MDLLLRSWIQPESISGSFREVARVTLLVKAIEGSPGSRSPARAALAFRRVPVSQRKCSSQSGPHRRKPAHTRATPNAWLHSSQEAQAWHLAAGAAQTGAMPSGTSRPGPRGQPLSWGISTGARLTASSGFMQTEEDSSVCSVPLTLLWTYVLPGGGLVDTDCSICSRTGPVSTSRVISLLGRVCLGPRQSSCWPEA